MNLKTTINLQAGGPGSGCTGPNCGRPAHFAETRGGKNEVSSINQEIKFMKKMLKRKSGATTQQRKRYRALIKIYQAHLRGLGRQLTHQYPPVSISPKAVRKAEIVKQYNLANGAKYTFVTATKRGRPAGSGNAAKSSLKKAHDQKGTFSATHEDIKPLSYEGRVSVYDANKPNGRGSTVIVNRDLDKNRVVVQEFSRQGNTIDANLQQFKFRNFGQAAGMLNKRYGIRQKLPKK